MSVLIKGMKMPKTCIMCWLSPICPVWVKEVSRHKGYDNRLSDCPLIEVPTPHGRLIDADRLYKNYQEICSDIACTTCPFLNEDGCEVEQMIRYAPTITEAEEG